MHNVKDQNVVLKACATIEKTWNDLYNLADIPYEDYDEPLEVIKEDENG